MHPRLLVICGPTASGKTKLALQLAKEFNGVVISADSRQVYKFMKIGTGRGEKQSLSLRDEEILGYDLVNPNEEFSVSQYMKFATKAIQEIHAENRLPILVGGTGLYIKAIIDGIDTINVPPDANLRSAYAEATVEELFGELKKINPGKAESMNESDRKNPRRIIRAIEIANAKKTNAKFTRSNYDVLMIGLTANLRELEVRIGKRVEERIKNGFEEEVKFLKNNGYWDGAPKVTLGYKDWPDTEKWKNEEFKYAKRQMTWFKNDKRINWFDVSNDNYLKAVENLVQKWYSQVDHAKEN